MWTEIITVRKGRFLGLLGGVSFFLISCGGESNIEIITGVEEPPVTSPETPDLNCLSFPSDYDFIVNKNGTPIGDVAVIKEWDQANLIVNSTTTENDIELISTKHYASLDEMVKSEFELGFTLFESQAFERDVESISGEVIAEVNQTINDDGELVSSEKSILSPDFVEKTDSHFWLRHDGFGRPLLGVFESYTKTSDESFPYWGHVCAGIVVTIQYDDEGKRIEMNQQDPGQESCIADITLDPFNKWPAAEFVSKTDFNENNLIARQEIISKVDGEEVTDIFEYSYTYNSFVDVCL